MWKSKMSNFVTLVLVMFFFFIFTGQAMAVDLGDGVETGMTLPDVSEALADTENHILEEKDIDDQRCFDIYHRADTGEYYFFYSGSGDVEEENSYLEDELIYKLTFYNNESRESAHKFFEKKCGEPTVLESPDGDGSTYFYSTGDVGYKIMDYNEELFQIWHGSVEMWNEIAEDNTFREFPVE